MNAAELATLTDEEFNKLVDLTCAQQGVAMIPQEPVEPPPRTITPDLFLTAIDSMVVDRDLADAIRTLLDERGYVWTQNYTTKNYKKLFMSTNEYNLPKFQVYSAESAEALARGESARIQSKQQWDVYNELRDAYGEAVDAREEVAQSIRDQMWAAQKDLADKERYNNAWAKYLEMADGSRKIARKFFCDCYDVDTFDTYIGGEDNDSV